MINNQWLITKANTPASIATKVAIIKPTAQPKPSFNLPSTASILAKIKSSLASNLVSILVPVRLVNSIKSVITSLASSFVKPLATKVSYKRISGEPLTCGSKFLLSIKKSFTKYISEYTTNSNHMQVGAI